jgi:HdeA/HdeB family protein
MEIVMRFALLAALVLASLSTGAQAQTLACDAFAKNGDGSWTALRNVRVPGPGTTFNVNGGAVFRPTDSFMGMNLAQTLDHDCPAQSQAPAEAATRVELPKLADAKGNIDIQELTCGQLASTYQEDADFLLTWYSGWYNGLAKAHVLNVARVKDSVHEIIAYCKANTGKRVTQAIEAMRK